MKFQLRKLGCALTCYEDAVPKLLCAPLNNEVRCDSCAALQKLKKLNCAFCAGLLLVEKIFAVCFWYTVMSFVPTSRASKRKFSRGYESLYRAPKSYWAPQALSGPMLLNLFLSDEHRSSFKSKGITIFRIRIQLGPMKNTTRRKIGLNPARRFGGTLWVPPAGSGAEPESFSTFYVSRG